MRRMRRGSWTQSLQFQVVRYLSGGRIDASFGTNGFGQMTSFGSSANPKGPAVGSNGEFVAVGGSGGDAAVARWLG